MNLTLPTLPIQPLTNPYLFPNHRPQIKCTAAATKINENVRNYLVRSKFNKNLWVSY
jgi:hypothetical protein